MKCESSIGEMNQKNLYGDTLELCSLDPCTGWFRDGYARTDSNDQGTHVACATMTQEVQKKATKVAKNNFESFQFLDYTKSQGNDLSTPHLPGFPGLKPGDRWVICILRWHEAQKAGHAPLLKLKATNQKALEYVDLELLEEYDDNKF